MKLMLADEAHDSWVEFEVIDIKREGETLAIVSRPLTLIVGPFDEFAEAIVDLVGKEDA